MLAPGLALPITRSHAEIDCFRSEFSRVDERFLLQGQPELGRIAAQRFTEEARRCNAGDGERMPLDDEGRSHDRRIGVVLLLPGAITQHGYRWRGGLIVTGSDGAAGEGANAEGREVVAGDEFAAQWFGHGCRAVRGAR